jgi:hypothetical protein
MDILERPSRNPLFTGQGGVGRTSVARRRIVDEGEHGFGVIDTAPTGYSLLLLDAAESRHREVLRPSGSSPEDVRRHLPRLRDASKAEVAP